MLVRIITALVLAPFAILLTLYLPTKWLSMVFLIVMLTALYEWNRLTINSNKRYLLAGAGLAVATWWLISRPGWLYAVCILVSLFWVWQIFNLKRCAVSKSPNSEISFFFGIFCLLGAWAALILLHQQSINGPISTIALLVMIWAADSFAYFTGKALGERKLAPALSPNKTIEGVIGGLLGSSLIAGVFGLFVIDISTAEVIFLVFAGFCAAVFSVTGDLYESRMKRIAGVKDSGNLLPGHGGVLDRIDGLIAGAPVFLALWYSRQWLQL